MSLNENDQEIVERTILCLEKILNDFLQSYLRCRICGLMHQSHPWGKDNNFPSYEMCSCCGAIFGLQDETLEKIKNHRIQWIEKGYRWSEENKKPLGWSPENQMMNIQKDYL